MSFEYDAADNVESITNTVAAGDSEAFQYDRNSRLIEAIGPYGEFDYAYDSNGNRTAFIIDDDPTGIRSSTYTYYANTNRLEENIPGSANFSFDRDYDESGNTISRTPQSGSVSYQYAYGDDGRLAQVFRNHSKKYGNRELIIRKNGFGQPAIEQFVSPKTGRKYDRSRFI